MRPKKDGERLSDEPYPAFSPVLHSVLPMLYSRLHLFHRLLFYCPCLSVETSLSKSVPLPRSPVFILLLLN
jgi:hypothetical protein